MKRSFSYDSLDCLSPSPAPSPVLSSALDQSLPTRTPSSPSDIKPKIINSTSGSTKVKKTPSPKKAKTTSTTSASGVGSQSSPTATANGIWDAEKRALFMDEIIATGYKAVDLGGLASKVS